MSFALALFSFAFVSLGYASPLVFHGEFASARHKVTYKEGYDKFSCFEENGEWMENRGCIFHGMNSLSVVKNGNSWFARVSTITANAGLCDFEGEANIVSPGVLLATAEGEEFVPGNASGTGKWVPATCEMLITFQKDGSVSAKERNFRKCASFCDATGLLEIRRAFRKKK
jgi:hypothetical protein